MRELEGCPPILQASLPGPASKLLPLGSACVCACEETSSCATGQSATRELRPATTGCRAPRCAPLLHLCALGQGLVLYLDRLSLARRSQARGKTVGALRLHSGYHGQDGQDPGLWGLPGFSPVALCDSCGPLSALSALRCCHALAGCHAFAVSTLACWLQVREQQSLHVCVRSMR